MSKATREVLTDRKGYRGEGVRRDSAGQAAGPEWYFDFEVDVEMIFDIAAVGGLIIRSSVVEKSRRTSNRPNYRSDSRGRSGIVQNNLSRVGWTREL